MKLAILETFSPIERIRRLLVISIKLAMFASRTLQFSHHPRSTQKSIDKFFNGSRVSDKLISVVRVNFVDSKQGEGGGKLKAR